MKTCSIVYLLLTMAGVLPIRFGFAQHKSSVGVNIIMNPIQTIHIEDKHARVSEGKEGEDAEKAVDDQKIISFGTSAYQVTVDRKEGLGSGDRPVGMLSQRVRTAVRRLSDAVPQRENKQPEGKPLVFYSIRVN